MEDKGSETCKKAWSVSSSATEKSNKKEVENFIGFSSGTPLVIMMKTVSMDKRG